MAKKSFVRKTQRTIVGAAKSSAAHIQKVAVRAATAALTAAAEACLCKCPLMTQSRPRRALPRHSASPLELTRSKFQRSSKPGFGPGFLLNQCPLLTQSGHSGPSGAPLFLSNLAVAPFECDPF
jgi:hypothetical protein